MAARPQGAPCHPMETRGVHPKGPRRAGCCQVSRHTQVRGLSCPSPLPLGFHLLMIEIMSSLLNLSVSHLPGAPGGETPSTVQPDVICVYGLF